MTGMQQGAPQGSPLSPVLWLIQIAKVLRRADDILRQPVPAHSRELRRQPKRPHISTSDLFSYVDDINPPTATRGSRKDHMAAIRATDGPLNRAAAEEGLTWDQMKESELNFNQNGQSPIVTLGITLDHTLNFRKHIENRTTKAAAVWSAMQRLK